MNKPQILFRTGLFSGAGSFACCLAGMETAQYILALVCLTAFMLADRFKDKQVKNQYKVSSRSKF